MGILSRFNEIMSSNVNALLDKMEDPAKMVDQKLREAREALADVRQETATIMANETRAKENRDHLDSEIRRFQKLAEKAVLAGNDGDARVFLEKKNALSGQLVSADETYKAAHAQAEQLRQMHNKLVNDIKDMEARRESIKATVATAKAQESVNKLQQGITRAGNLTSTFDDMENKAKSRLAKAQAMAALNTEPTDEADSLAAKYGVEGAGETVDDELAALRAKLRGEVADT